MKIAKENPIILFILVLTVLSGGAYTLMYKNGESDSVLIMWVPAVAAVICKLLARQSLVKGVGWNPVKPWRWMLMAMLLPLLIIVVIVGVQVALGFVEYKATFLTLENGLVQVRGVAMIFGAEPQPIILFIGNFLLSFFVGNILYMLAFALGEEYGWRAHLQTLFLQKYSAKKTFILLGTIWGLWHLPAILMGHNYPEYPLVGGLVLMPITCIAFSVVFGIAYLKSKSIWVPIMFHSALNLSAGMDDKMIGTKTNVLGADLVWTGMWLAAALIIYLVTTKMNDKSMCVAAGVEKQ